MRSHSGRAGLGMAVLVASTLGVIAIAPTTAQAATTSFTTPGCQAWTVPLGVTEIQITAVGAAGSAAFPGAPAGGTGDGVSATLSGLTTGETLFVCVNAGGGTGGGAPGGGNAGSGGGASGVARGSDFSAPILVAGGGGGGGGGSGAHPSGGAGGPAGSPDGFPGATPTDTGTDVGGGGGGGTASGGGGGGAGHFTCGAGSGGGSFGPSGPGAGGGGGGCNFNVEAGGGGGGGGYFGGGGGGGGLFGGGGGGGGSDFCSTDGAVTDCAVTSGAGTETDAGSGPGQAKVVITDSRLDTTTGVSVSPASPVFGATVTATATVDPVPGGGTVQFALDGNNVGNPVPVDTTTGTASTNLTGLSVGGHSITATYSGAIGFAGSAGQATFTVARAPTTTSVATAPAGPVFGDTITATATVNPVPDGGTVQFAVDGTDVGSPVSVDTGTGTASKDLIGLSGGEHTITATYSGNTDFSGSSGRADITIARAATALTATPAILQVSPLALEVFNLSATLTRESDGSPLAGQTVVFSAGSTELCTSTTDASGVATCNVLMSPTAILAVVLSNGYAVSFPGDGNYAPSTASAGLIG